MGKLKAEKANAMQMPSVTETKKKDSNKQQASSSSSSGVNSKAVAATNNAENGCIPSIEKGKQPSELLKVMEMATPSSTSTKVIAPAPAPAPIATAPNVSLAPRTIPIASPITSNSRRRKSISVANHTPAKAMMISSRRDTINFEAFPRIREHQPPELHKKAAVFPMTKFELPAIAPPFAATSSHLHQPPAPAVTTTASSSSSQQTKQTKQTTKPNDNDVQIIEAFVQPHSLGTIKGTRNVMNAISQGAQLVKVINSQIIKQPVNLANMYVTTTAGKSAPAPVQQQQPAKAAPAETTIRLPQSTYKAHKIQGIAPNASQPPANNVIQNSIPTARNPNIVKTSDKTIMHVSPHLLSQKSIQIIKTSAGAASSISQNNHHVATSIAASAAGTSTQKYQKHVVQVVQPQSQPQPRTITIHPSSAILNGIQMFFFCLRL